MRQTDPPLVVKDRCQARVAAHLQAEPERLPGLTKSASCKEGPSLEERMNMKQAEIYVGIDVAKDRVDVSIRPGGDTWSADYDERGMSELVSCLRTAEPTAVLLEATGGLEGANIRSCGN